MTFDISGLAPCYRFTAAIWNGVLVSGSSGSNGNSIMFVDDSGAVLWADHIAPDENRSVAFNFRCSDIDINLSHRSSLDSTNAVTKAPCRVGYITLLDASC